MIAIALGANLPSMVGQPLETLRTVVRELPKCGIEVVAVSQWYESTPIPASDQPLYINGVISVATTLGPAALLNSLLSIEDDYGRERREANASRTLDLDVLDYEGRVESGPPILPHPRLENRCFVLFPLRDIAPDWRHPVSGLQLEALLMNLEAPVKIRQIS
ncbi:MAG: 2-amino-4-hydroxy-6-hydroxymethyldihydropteridine diphosphokinase [Rhodospirillaceae bacterium]|nr:2-amino-4-hydroxy-6-hydroxymethyldihydropteridine diphosphokinase [Rhodospirillaceae bacterium]